MAGLRHGRKGGFRQSGATAVEFALIFPALFATVYAGLTYGFVFFLQQQVNFAAQEAVRAAIAQDPADPAFIALVNNAALTAVKLNYGVAPTALLPTRVTGPTVSFPVPSTVSIVVNFSLVDIFPAITLPVVGTVPLLPASLTGRAVGRVS